jgi:hypothetical protein
VLSIPLVRGPKSVLSLRALVRVRADIWIYSVRREGRPVPYLSVGAWMRPAGNELGRFIQILARCANLLSRKAISAREKGAMGKTYVILGMRTCLMMLRACRGGILALMSCCPLVRMVETSSFRWYEKFRVIVM